MKKSLLLLMHLKNITENILPGRKNQQPFYIKITSINRRDPPSSLGIRIQPPWQKIATNSQKSGTVCHEKRAEFLQTRGPYRHLFLFNDDTWEKSEGGYCI